MATPSAPPLSLSVSAGLTPDQLAARARIQQNPLPPPPMSPPPDYSPHPPAYDSLEPYPPPSVVHNNLVGNGNNPLIGNNAMVGNNAMPGNNAMVGNHVMTGNNGLPVNYSSNSLNRITNNSNHVDGNPHAQRAATPSDFNNNNDQTLNANGMASMASSNNPSNSNGTYVKKGVSFSNAISPLFYRS